MVGAVCLAIASLSALLLITVTKEDMAEASATVLAV
jgi:hypothetical protein